MKHLLGAMAAARHSPFRMWLLNRMLWTGIPFNAPHRLKIVKLEDDAVHISIPFKRNNLNHLRGLHACVMATASEYASGLALLQQADAGKYRLIMQKMEVEYHAQGRKAAVATSRLSAAEVEESILRPLQSAESVIYPSKSEVHDLDGRHLCTATVYWQLKPWDKVRSPGASQS